jgi:hypothetical protein
LIVRIDGERLGRKLTAILGRAVLVGACPAGVLHRDGAERPVETRPLGERLHHPLSPAPDDIAHLVGLKPSEASKALHAREPSGQQPTRYGPRGLAVAARTRLRELLEQLGVAGVLIRRRVDRHCPHLYRQNSRNRYRQRGGARYVRGFPSEHGSSRHKQG